MNFFNLAILTLRINLLRSLLVKVTSKQRILSISHIVTCLREVQACLVELRHVVSSRHTKNTLALRSFFYSSFLLYGHSLVRIHLVKSRAHRLNWIYDQLNRRESFLQIFSCFQVAILVPTLLLFYLFFVFILNLVLL